MDVPDVPQVLVLPGVPGGADTVSDGRGAYPIVTSDVVKLLREAGLSVEYRQGRVDRAEIALHADELWIPILLFGIDVLASGGGTVLVDAIYSLVGGKKAPASTLHLRVGRSSVSAVEWFEADGRGPEVLEAFESWSNSGGS